MILHFRSHVLRPRYDATLVPVGDDQLQHIELCRDVARSFNSRFVPSQAGSDSFRLPSAVFSGSSNSLHRIMSLENPTSKMSKSDVSPHAAIFLDDSNDRFLTHFINIFLALGAVNCHFCYTHQFSYPFCFLSAFLPKSSVQ